VRRCGCIFRAKINHKKARQEYENSCRAFFISIFRRIPAMSTHLNPPAPFDAASENRLQYMGLLKKNRTANEDALAVIAAIYAGLLFDDLLNCFDDSKPVKYPKNLLEGWTGSKNGAPYLRWHST